MTLEPCDELERLEDRISTNTRWVVGLLLAVLIPLAAGSIRVYAQVANDVQQMESHEKRDDQRASVLADVAKRQSIVEGSIIGIGVRQDAMAADIIEVKESLKANNIILEDIRREVRK